jgi:hypothetical protein
MYVIWSNEHKGWWRQNRLGYTKSIAEAGVYSRDDAVEITEQATWEWSGPTPNELPVRIEDLPLSARVLLGQA